jgi:hypothetical protein
VDQGGSADIDVEGALPWQKLAGAISDLLAAEGDLDRYRQGDLDPYEARVQAVYDKLLAGHVLDPVEIRQRMDAMALALAGDKDRAHAKTRFSNVRPNDIGGLPGGPIGMREAELAPWQRLALALCTVLHERRLATLPERRRATEDLGDDYNRLSYFERMVQSAAAILDEKAILTFAEIEHRLHAGRGGTE